MSFVSASVRLVPAVRGRAAVLIPAVAVAAVLGVMSARYGSVALAGACVVLLIGIAAVDLALVPALAVGATLLQMRVGGLLAVSDVVLALAAVVGVLMLRGRGAAALQPLIWAGLAYLVVIIPTLILNPFSADLIEWVHEFFLVVGSMIVGYALAREGMAPFAFGLYAVACSVIGLMAAVVFVRTGFQPAYLPSLQKNTIGGMLAASAVISYARPSWLKWRPWFANLTLAACAIGVLASQSRQGMVGGAVGLLVVSMRSRVLGRRARKWIWLAVIPVGIFVWNEAAKQLASANRFNSAHQRLAWYSETLAVWRQSPIFGVGLRWWYVPEYGANFQPPNAEMEVMSCVGIVGLAAFFAMFLAACWLLLKLDPAYGTLGLAIVLTRFSQAQFDIYWVAGQASLLWIVAGACYGAMQRDRAQPPLRALPRSRALAPRHLAAVR